MEAHKNANMIARVKASSQESATPLFIEEGTKTVPTSCTKSRTSGDLQMVTRALQCPPTSGRWQVAIGVAKHRYSSLRWSLKLTVPALATSIVKNYTEVSPGDISGAHWRILQKQINCPKVYRNVFRTTGPLSCSPQFSVAPGQFQWPPQPSLFKASELALPWPPKYNTPTYRQHIRHLSSENYSNDPPKSSGAQ